jgi:hypothetical protein
MENIAQLELVYKKLVASGRIKEILGEDGKVQPSEKALEKMSSDYPNCRTDEEAAFAWRTAVAQTLLDLADKYQAEMQ